MCLSWHQTLCRWAQCFVAGDVPDVEQVEENISSVSVRSLHQLFGTVDSIFGESTWLWVFRAAGDMHKVPLLGKHLDLPAWKCRTPVQKSIQFSAMFPSKTSGSGLLNPSTIFRDINCATLTSPRLGRKKMNKRKKISQKTQRRLVRQNFWHHADVRVRGEVTSPYFAYTHWLYW